MNISVLVYEIINLITFVLPVLIPLSALIFLFIPSRKLLALFLLLLGVQAIFVDMGVMVNIPRVLIFFTLLTLIIYYPKEFGGAVMEYPGRIILLVIFVFFIASALLNIPNFPVKNIITAYGHVGDTLFRDRATRQASQILMFLLKASIPLAILAVCRTRKDVIKMLKITLAGTSLLCAYGIYQYIAYVYNLPAIYIFRGAMNPQGAIGLFSTPFGTFLRISSLAGEPKDLAGILLPVTIFMGAFAWRVLMENKYYGTRKIIAIIILVLHAGIFIMTFSTAGWIGGIVAVVSALVFSVNWQPKLITFLFGFSVFLAVAALYFYVPSINDVVNKRLIDRVKIEYLTKNADYGGPQLLHMYKTRPETIFYGASLGGAVFYEQYNEQPESIVYYLFDYGLIGIFLLFTFFYYVLKNMIFLANRYNLKGDILFNSLMYAAVGSMAGTLFFPKIDAMLGLWVIIGLLSALVIHSGDFGIGHNEMATPKLF